MRVIGIAAAFIVVFAAAADEPRDARGVEQALQAVIAKAEPAVACLLVYRPDRVDSNRSPLKDDAVPDYYASGVVVDAAGKILTNYHFLREAAGEGQDPASLRIRVRLPADRFGTETGGQPREALATVLAADAKSDLAVLRIEPGRRPAGTIPFGRGEELKKGSFVVSLAHPYASGYRDGSPSASTGIVSNLRRRSPSSTNESDRAKLPLNQFATLIQTDVRLQLGTSGGALLDLDGKLVGLTTAAAALTGVDAPGGYAIPMDEAVRGIVEVLVRGEEVEYGFLGISVRQDFGRYIRRGEGVQIGTVHDNTPAAERLRPNDVILQINGRPIREYDDLFYRLATTLAGRRASMLVRRDGEDRLVEVTLLKSPTGEIDHVAHRPKDAYASVAAVRPREWFGLRVEYTSVANKEANAVPRGVLVREVRGSAATAGLVPYEDIIVRVNDRPVNSPADFLREADKAPAGEPLRLTLAGEPPRTVTLR
jgi:serine protease Do